MLLLRSLLNNETHFYCCSVIRTCRCQFSYCFMDTKEIVWFLELK